MIMQGMRDICRMVVFIEVGAGEWGLSGNT